MASVLSRAVSFSAPISARSLLRASRSGIILPRSALQPVQSSALRWSSAAAAARKSFVEDVSEPFEVIETETMEAPLANGNGHYLQFEKSRIVSAEDAGENDHAAIETDQPAFSTLKDVISPGTLQALTVAPMQLTHMSPVQAAVLPLLPDLIQPPQSDADEEQVGGAPRDLLVKARTGTGKTIAFLVPAIEARLAEIKRFGVKAKQDAGLDSRFQTRAERQFGREQAGVIIISPTRELATQIAVEATKLVKHHKELTTHLLVGGESKREQMRHWMKSTRDIVVATPGRLRDMLENEPDVAGPISRCKMLILDEADSLLDMGFREDIEAIAREMPQAPERQTFMFSATVSRPIQQVARAALAKNHLFINCVSSDASPVHAHIPQHHTILPSAADQIPHVLRLIAHDQLTNPGHSKVLIFFPTTKMTQLFGTILTEMRKSLPNSRTRIFEMHSKRTQQQRTKMSNEFRNDKSGAAVMVSSDVSARGVDYPGITRIIQVGVPTSTEQYVHRVGRTGRGTDKSGRADLVLLPFEAGFVSWQLTDVPMKALTVQELAPELEKLAGEHDSHSSPRHKLTHPYTPKLEAFATEIQKLQENLDEDAVKETMSSLLGFYVGRTGDLRCPKNVMVAGLKDWSVTAGGLAEPPYIPEAFLTKLGLGQGKADRRGVQSYKRNSRGSSGQWNSRSDRGDRSRGGWDRGDYDDGGYRGRGRDRDPFSSEFRPRQRQSSKQESWFMRGRERASE